MWVFSVSLPLPDGTAKTRIVFISVSSILFLSSIDWPSIKSWPKTHTIGWVVEVNMSDHSICNLPSFRIVAYGCSFLLQDCFEQIENTVRHTPESFVCVLYKSLMWIPHTTQTYITTKCIICSVLINQPSSYLLDCFEEITWAVNALWLITLVAQEDDIMIVQTGWWQHKNGHSSKI